jgi:hypothetical protein
VLGTVEVVTLQRFQSINAAARAELLRDEKPTVVCGTFDAAEPFFRYRQIGRGMA